MSPEQENASALPLAERLTLATDAFRRFRTACFWFMRPDYVPTVEDLPRLAEGLRRHGGRAGWMIAARLCP